MDRRAFMALLGLGPAFKRLVPAVVEPLALHIGVLYDEPAPSLTRESFDRFLSDVMHENRKAADPMWFCHPRSFDAWRRELPSCVKVVPYAAPPEETT